MKGRLWIVCVLCVILAPWRVLGDGTIIHPTAFAKVQIPDQRALIHFSNGVETLVIDTSFKGEGSNFAWIVPVPSVPEVEAATPGLFATLQISFQPRVVHNVGKYFVAVFLFGAVIALLIWNQKQGKPVLDLLLFFLFLLLLAGFLLPTAGTGRGPVSMGNVEIIDRKTVGAYESVTLSSPDGSDLLAWLGQNGYATPTNLLPAIQAYAREGWCFVASKLRAETNLAGPARAHPLLFRFKTEAPVYPLRLTGVGNTNCIVELYVFGPGRAQTASFQVVRCETPSYEKRGFWQFTPNADFIRIRHPLLEKIVVNSPVATKLSATLNSASMQKDCYITWIPYQRVRPTYYSHDGATTFAINMLVTTLVTVGLIWLLLHRIEGGWAKWLRKACGWLAVLGVVASLAVYVLLPKVEVTLSRMPVMRMRSTIVQVSSGLAIAWKNERAGRASTNDPDVNWVRQQMAVNSELRRSFSPNFRQNPLTGTDWKEEDSPGNYTLRRNGNLVEVVWYDFNGDEIVESPFESKTAPK